MGKVDQGKELNVGISYKLQQLSSVLYQDISKNDEKLFICYLPRIYCIFNV